MNEQSSFACHWTVMCADMIIIWLMNNNKNQCIGLSRAYMNISSRAIMIIQ